MVYSHETFTTNSQHIKDHPQTISGQTEYQVALDKSRIESVLGPVQKFFCQCARVLAAPSPTFLAFNPQRIRYQKFNQTLPKS